MTNNDTATIRLNNNHGLFTADSDKVELLLLKTASWDRTLLRRQVAGCCGHPESDIDAYRDCTWLELCIIWVDSGNFVL
jgi:hypothetical protein